MVKRDKTKLTVPSDEEYANEKPQSEKESTGSLDFPSTPEEKKSGGF